MTIDFRPSGELRHTVQYFDRLRVSDHHYRIEDDVIYVTPPESDEHELARFTFEDHDQLILVTKGKRSWFRRDSGHLTGE